MVANITAKYAAQEADAAEESDMRQPAQQWKGGHVGRHDGENGQNGQQISKAEYEALAGFRHALRSFLRFSEVAARAEGLTPQHHQLLLAIKGMPGREWTTVGELAHALELTHNGAVQLVDRAEKLDLVRRSTGRVDRRVVEVRLTQAGERILARLVDLHCHELQRVSDDLVEALNRVLHGS